MNYYKNTQERQAIRPFKNKAKAKKLPSISVDLQTIAGAEKKYFIDKNTGEYFASMNRVRINDRNHCHLKSEGSREILLLSEYGIQRRFLENTDGTKKPMRDLNRVFLGLT